MSEALTRLVALKARKHDVLQELQYPTLHGFDEDDTRRMKESLNILQGLINVCEAEVVKETAELARKRAIIEEENRKKRERLADLQFKLDLIWGNDLTVTERDGKYYISLPEHCELSYKSDVWEKKLDQTCKIFGVRQIWWTSLMNAAKEILDGMDESTFRSNNTLQTLYTNWSNVPLQTRNKFLEKLNARNNARKAIPGKLVFVNDWLFKRALGSAAYLRYKGRFRGAARRESERKKEEEVYAQNSRPVKRKIEEDSDSDDSDDDCLPAWPFKREKLEETSEDVDSPFSNPLWRVKEEPKDNMNDNNYSYRVKQEMED